MSDYDAIITFIEKLDAHTIRDALLCQAGNAIAHEKATFRGAEPPPGPRFKQYKAWLVDYHAVEAMRRDIREAAEREIYPIARRLSLRPEPVRVLLCFWTDFDPELASMKADAIAFLDKMIERLPREGDGITAVSDYKPDPIAIAVTILKDHPDWTNRKIAGKVHIHPSALSRSNLFKKARVLAMRTVPSGYRTTGRGIEATDAED